MHKFEWEPEIDIIRFGCADIITTSSIDDELDEDELPPVYIK